MNIAVIFGGESCEHDISIITGEQLIDNVNEYLYNIVPIYIDKQGVWKTGEELKDIDNFNIGFKKLHECSFVPNSKMLYIKKGKSYKPFVDIDCAIVCLHGLRGEDGSVAGVLELSKIPYSSSSLTASAVCMDKCVFKNFAKGLGIDVIQSIEISSSDMIDFDIVKRKVAGIGYPCIIKPSRQGSSIGIEVCDAEEDLLNKLRISLNYDTKVLIEKYVNIKREVNIAAFDDKGKIVLSNTEEPISSDKILSFDNKYLKNPGGFQTIKRIVPAGISEEQYLKLTNIAVKTYKMLDMFGVVRFDFIITEQDELYLNEVNTIPGSMANYLFDKDKYSYSKLVDLIVSNSVHRKKIDSTTKKVFESKVLSVGSIGFKK